MMLRPHNTQVQEIRQVGHGVQDQANRFFDSPTSLLSGRNIIRSSSSPPIRVTHLISGLPRGGAQTALAYLATQADPVRFRMTVISLTSLGSVGRDLEEAGIDVAALGMRAGSPNPLGLSRLRRLLVRRRPDILQCWMYHSDLLGGLVGATIPGVKVYWNLRQSDLHRHHSKRLTRLTARACAALSSRLPHTIVCGSQAAMHVHASLGYDRSRMVVIANGVDTDRFVPSEERRAFVRNELGMSDDTFLIGHLARFHPQKDHNTFLKAAGEVAKVSASARFVLCGSGADPSNRRLRSWIEAASLSGKVHLLGERHDVERIAAGLDLSVSSSSSAEGFSNSLAESLACGVPCVTTDIGDSRLIVGDAGITIRPEDPTAMSEAILTIAQLTNTEHTQLRSTARERAVKNFSIARNVSAYEALYEKTAKGVNPEDDPRFE